MLLIHTNIVETRYSLNAQRLRYKIPAIDTIKLSNTKMGKPIRIEKIFADASFSKMKLINLKAIVVEKLKYRIPIIIPSKINIFCSLESFIFVVNF